MKRERKLDWIKEEDVIAEVKRGSDRITRTKIDLKGNSLFNGPFASLVVRVPACKA